MEDSKVTGTRTSDFYKTVNLPEKFDNPGLFFHFHTLTFLLLF
jgi:hypothetical protein